MTTPESNAPATTPEPKTVTPAPGVLPTDGKVATAPVVPEAKQTAVVELKLPEGSLLDAKRIEEVKALGLDPKIAQSVLDHEHGALASFVSEQQKQSELEQAEWKKQVTTMYGEKTKENLELAHRVIARFDTEGKLQKVLDETGTGNFPALVQLFVEIGKTMADDTLTRPDGKPPVTSVQSTAAILYPKTPTKA